MRPLGPIPAGFGSLGGELAIDGVRASELVDRASDSEWIGHQPVCEHREHPA